jgi:hypothetical protein
MNSRIEGIKAATADAGPDIRVAVERLEAVSVEADKDAATRAASQAAVIRTTETRIDQITKQLEGKSGLKLRGARNCSTLYCNTTPTSTPTKAVL